MSEETVSPQPEELSKAEKTGSDAAAESAGTAEATPAAGPHGASGDDPAGAAAAGAAAAAAGTAAAQAAAASGLVEDGIAMRRSPWKSSMAAIQYVQNASRTNAVQLRTSDRVTIIALLFFCSVEVLSLVYTPLHGLRFAIMCFSDLILGFCIFFFLIYRIGILSALNTRQALICWQMMMGCAFLGIFLCLNTIFAVAWLVETFCPHPLP